ncbi:MAG: ATPase P [Desulfosarcina sp.]|jgi:soluble P-type ATPase
MFSHEIPGYGLLTLEHLVLDYNGTLAVDGEMLPGVKTILKTLSGQLSIHVVTADTFGKAANGLDGVDCRLTVLKAGNQDQAKVDFVNQLGADRTVCIGNGRNDARMLAAAALGIAVILDEGASMVSLNAADIVCTTIVSALELFMNPMRLTATLRA